MTNSNIDYESYWNMVIGSCRNAKDAVEEFGLEGQTRPQIAEWLSDCENTAADQMGNDDGFFDSEECYDYYETALDELEDAVDSLNS